MPGSWVSSPSRSALGGFGYRCGNGEFALFESAGAAAGDHTQMAWEVDDLEETIAELRERGVIFEEYDVPGLKTVHGIAEVEGNYPSEGNVGGKAAWFKDSEGNLLAIGQAVTCAASGVVLFAPAFPAHIPRRPGRRHVHDEHGQASSGRLAASPLPMVVRHAADSAARQYKQPLPSRSTTGHRTTIPAPLGATAAAIG
jgi:hypothetical protein